MKTQRTLISLGYIIAFSTGIFFLMHGGTGGLLTLGLLGGTVKIGLNLIKHTFNK
jgi:hypothetical protein